MKANSIRFKNGEFKKSSLTGVGGRWSCVEVARRKDVIGIRSTTDHTKTTLCYTPDEWKAFIGGVKNGEFDLES